MSKPTYLWRKLTSKQRDELAGPGEGRVPDQQVFRHRARPGVSVRCPPFRVFGEAACLKAGHQAGRLTPGHRTVGYPRFNVQVKRS